MQNQHTLHLTEMNANKISLVSGIGWSEDNPQQKRYRGNWNRKKNDGHQVSGER